MVSRPLATYRLTEDLPAFEMIDGIPYTIGLRPAVRSAAAPLRTRRTDVRAFGPACMCHVHTEIKIGIYFEVKRTAPKTPPLHEQRSFGKNADIWRPPLPEITLRLLIFLTPVENLQNYKAPERPVANLQYHRRINKNAQ